MFKNGELDKHARLTVAKCFVRQKQHTVRHRNVLCVAKNTVRKFFKPLFSIFFACSIILDIQILHPCGKTPTDISGAAGGIVCAICHPDIITRDSVKSRLFNSITANAYISQDAKLDSWRFADMFVSCFAVTPEKSWLCYCLKT